MPRSDPSALPYPAWSNRLRAARLARGLTLRQVARQLEASVTSVNKYECGRDRPPLEKLDRLCRIYGTTPNAILGWGAEAEGLGVARLPRDLAELVQRLCQVPPDIRRAMLKLARCAAAEPPRADSAA